jgi:hypothetical protein
MAQTAEEHRERLGLSRRITVNIYDLTESNRFLSFMGVGAYHSGVEIEGKEWTFSPAGVFFTAPRAEQLGKFKSSVDMGCHVASAQDFQQAIAELRREFPEGSYDLVKKNCNNFSDAMCKKLLRKGIPAWVNRAAMFGSTILKPSDEQRAKAAKEKVNKPTQKAAKEKYEARYYTFTSSYSAYQLNHSFDVL